MSRRNRPREGVLCECMYVCMYVCIPCDAAEWIILPLICINSIYMYEYTGGLYICTQLLYLWVLDLCLGMHVYVRVCVCVCVCVFEFLDLYVRECVCPRI
jgi:hypothetical protein